MATDLAAKAAALSALADKGHKAHKMHTEVPASVFSKLDAARRAGAQVKASGALGTVVAAPGHKAAVEAARTRYASPLMAETTSLEALLVSIDRCAQSARKAGLAYQIDYAVGKPTGIKVLG